jgi:hypothetical protein
MAADQAAHNECPLEFEDFRGELVDGGALKEGYCRKCASLGKRNILAADHPKRQQGNKKNTFNS